MGSCHSRAADLTWTNGSDYWQSTTAWTTNGTGGTGGYPGQIGTVSTNDSAWFTNAASYYVTLSNNVSVSSNFFSNASNTLAAVTLDLGTNVFTAAIGSNSFVIANNASSTSIVYVASSTQAQGGFVANGALVVGRNGVGIMYVTNGYVGMGASSDPGLKLGDGTNSCGTLVVSGTNTYFYAGRQLSVGSPASFGNSIVVSNGASITVVSTFRVGGSIDGGSSNNTFILDSGARATITGGHATIGKYKGTTGSYNNTMIIQGGAICTFQGTFNIGWDSSDGGPATNNVLTVGNGGTVSSTTALAINGSNTLNVAGGSFQSGPVTCSGTMNLAGGVIQESSSITCSGTIQGYGSITVPVNRYCTVSSGGFFSPFNALGQLTVSGGTLSLASGSTTTVQLGTNFNTTAVTGNLLLNGTLNFTNSGGFTNGTFTLFTYTGTLNTNGLTIGTTPDTNLTYSVVNVAASKHVNLIVAPPPVAGFSGSPTSGTVPLAVTFTDTSIGTITNWFWNFGDGVTTNTTTNNLSHTYNAGTNTVSLIVWAYGGSSTNIQSNYIVVTNPPPPVAGFSGSPTSGTAPLAVTFTDTSSGNITNRFWDFGDGTTTNITATSVNHTYSVAGTYTVSLTVSGYGGSGTHTQSNYIVALNPPHLVVTPGSLTCGSVTIGQTNSLNFNVINTGDVTLTGTAASTAPFAVTSGASYNVAGGQTSTVTVAFAPGSVATFNDSVIFASNGGDSTNAVSGISLTPGSITVTPSTIDFGALPTGTIAQASFVVTNSGGTAVSNGTATVTGGPFSIFAGANFSVPGFGTTSVTVQFAPVSVGAFTNSVVFATANGGDATNTVQGAGLTPACIAVTPSAVDWGTWVTGAVAQASFVVTNTGGIAVNSGTATVSGEPFTVVSGASFSVPGFGSTNVTVQFAPVGVGAFTDSVIFATDNGGNSTNTVSGTGAGHPTDFVWTNGSDYWQSTTAWTPAGGFPGTNDSALFTNAATYSVTLTNDVTVQSNYFSNVSNTTATVTLDLGTNAFNVAYPGSDPGAFVVGNAADSTTTVYLASSTQGLTIPGRIIVGRSGIGTMIVTDGYVKVVNTASGRTILGNAGSGRGTLVLSGTNTLWDSRYVSIGNNSNTSGNLLVITNGARMNLLSTFRLGCGITHGGSVSNMLILDTGGKLSVMGGSPITIGHGSYGPAPSYDNIAIVRGGGAWDNGNHHFLIGSAYGGTATGNVLTVGVGGFVTNFSHLWITASNTLDMAGGLLGGSIAHPLAGTVTNLGVFQGFGTSIGNLIVTNGGFFSPFNSLGALVFSNSLRITSNSTTTVQLGSNFYTTVVASNLTLDGTLNITDAGGFTNGTYTLFTYGGTLTTNGTPTVLTIGTKPNSNWTYTVDISSAGYVKLTAEPPPPVAGYSGSPTSGAVPLGVNFTDASSGWITNWFWSFGDGSTTNFAASTNPLYPYSVGGSYTVIQIVSGPGGSSTNTQSNYILALNPPHLVVDPESLDYGSVTIGQTNSLIFSVINTGDLSLSGTVSVASPFAVTGSASYTVAAGQTQTVVVAFAPDNDWPFVADVIFTSNGGESTNSVTGTGLTPGHIMVTPAAQDLDTLATGTTAQATFTVANSGGTAVSNGTAAVSGPFSILAGASFSVPGFGSTDVVVEFAPASPGAFTNNVIFTTANGGDATNPVTGTGAIVPVADFSASPTNGAWPLAVTFTDTSTGTINYRSWDLGDGPITNTTATTLNHTYAAAGTYTVTLFVSGPLGFSDLTRTDYIVVVNPPVADFSATPTNGLMPLLVNFTDASTGDVTNRLWSFGDGDTSNDTNPSHTYTNVGTYSVTLTDYGPYGTAEKTQTNLITVSAVLATWTNANVSGNWSEAPSWDPVAIPDYGSSVIFGAAGTTSVVDGVSRTVGNITFDRAADFFVSAAGEATLTINNGIAVLTIFTYTISPPLLLGADNVWSVTTGGILLVTGPVSGTNSITEIGGGTLVLSGTNTYEGGTTVSNGILLVNNSGGSGTGTGVVQVVSGAILGGDGVIEGPVTIADGGLLSPGSDGVGALTISNNLALDSASVLQYELGTNSDLTAVSGNLTLDGILNITDAGGFTNGTYTLFTYGGTLTTNGSPTILTIGTTPDTNLIYTVDISSSGSVVLIVVASPPVADFSGSPTSGPWPLTMTFTDTSTGYITDRFWDFGDGNTTNTTETSLEYTYTAAGTYTVSLTVRGPGGTNTITRSDYVAVVNPPHLEVAPESLDYGSVTIGQTNSLTFSVINTGDVTLDGTATSVSPFNLISGASYTVAAGQTQTVVVAFAPDNDWPFVADVIFTSNGGESTNSVTGTGLTPGHITVTPAAQDFDTLATGTTAQATFTVANSGGTAVSNGTASVSGPFSILAGASFSVPGFGSTNVVVEFAPASAGTFTNNVIFTTANGGDATNPVTGTGAIVPVADFSASPTNGAWPLAVTFTDTSTGTINYRSWDLGDGPITNTTATSLSHTYAAAGTYTVTLFVSGPLGFNDLTRTNYIVVVNPPNLVINPGSLTYGSVTIGQTNSLSFSVINTGEATLSGTATSAAPFAVAGGAVYSVAGGQTQTVTVAFAPGTSGTFNDSVIFTSNGGDSTNAVNGTGLTSGSITVTPTAHDFGTLATGTTAQTSFTVTNSGGTAVSNGTATVSSPYTIVSGATFSVAGFSSTNVVVRFAPVSAGDFTNNVIFATANGGVATNAVTGTGAIVPVASFSASPTNGPWPLAVTFTDGSTGTITNRHWDLGDGTTTNTTATTLNHTYASVGTNTVSLTVSGPVGPNNQTRSAYIVVVNPSHLVVNPGSRNFGSVTIGRTDNLSFSVINTGDLPLSGTASSAAPFSVSSGGAYNNLAGGQTQTVTVAFAPSSAGAFTGSVIFASDGGNSTNTVIGTGLTPGSISVTPAVHDFGALATGTTVQASFVVTNAGGTAVSNGTAAVLGGPFAIMAGATFSVPGLGTSNITVQFAPVSAGAFTNSVTFASDNGGSATNTVIGTGAIVPVASFTGTPTNGALPLAVTFTDNSSGTITDRFWNFGDGNTSNTIATSVSHSYSVAGTNMVSLTVSGPVGTNTQTRSNYIVAHNPPVANFSASPTLGPVALTVTFTDSSTGNITNRFWNFGDGHTTNTLAASLGHTYNAFGTNTVSLTVFGMGGWCATNRVNYVVVTNFVVDVTPPQLQIVSPMDYQAFTNANITVTGVASDASGINGVTVNGSAASAAGTNWSQSVTLSLGTNTFAVIAIDASPKLNAATQTVHAVLLPNHPPQITAGLSVTNALLNVGNTSVVVANDTNMFAVSATDVDGNLLNYQWDFGDGRNGNSLVAIVGHVYTNDCGPYNASVTVSDGQVSTNSGRTVIVACQMQITKMQVKLSFSKPNADSCSLTANIVLPNGFTTAGKSVTLNISGAQSSFTLDAKGKGVNAQGSCGFKFNKKTGGWTISVKLGKTNLQDAWADDGLANTTLPKTGTSVTLTVAVLVDDEAFAADRTLLYRTAAGKSGSAK